MGQYDEIKEDVAEIKLDIKDIKKDLAEHMSRTQLNEQRIEHMEEFAKSAMTTQQDNFKLMLEANDKAMARLNSQLKIALGVVVSLAGLVSAYAAFFN